MKFEISKPKLVKKMKFRLHIFHLYKLLAIGQITMKYL